MQIFFTSWLPSTQFRKKPAHTTRSLCNRTTHYRIPRCIQGAQLPIEDEADWIVVDVSVRGLGAEAGLYAKELRNDGCDLVRCAMKNEPAELSVVLCDDEEMLKLNSHWRGKNFPTDVLSFPQNDEVILGDIVISLETARLQASRRQVSVRDELRVLLVHGLLHLLGYDHDKSAADLQLMASAEQRLLKRLEWSGTGLISLATETNHWGSIHEN